MIEMHPIHLTPRELEILSLVVEGKSGKEIAAELFISKRTVDYHVASAYGKLRVNNRMQAFHRAAGLGLIPRRLFTD